MLFSQGHGQKIVTASHTDADIPAETRQAAGADIPAMLRALADTGEMPRQGAFRYLFPDAAGLAASPQMPAALDDLAASMIAPHDGSFSRLPPVLTCFGQFIDHDTAANSEGDDAFAVTAGDLRPRPRRAVERDLVNLRLGALGLDSLYGATPVQHGFATTLADLMRHPDNDRKMRLGIPVPSENRPPLPADPAADLLRLGFLMDRGDITLCELQALPFELRQSFLDGAGQPIRARAIIGDGRNDENLLIAQLHVAFLRFHNRLADAWPNAPFEDIRRMARFHYQWLVVNDFLIRVCDPQILAEVIGRGAPLYSEFFYDNPPDRPGRMPLPLEFSAAAFRFRLSMMRGSYNHNGNRAATLGQLMRLTGNGGMRASDDCPKGDALPAGWIIDWNRFVHARDDAHSARRIDTHLVAPPEDPAGESAAIFRSLAQRSLRRGYVLDLPTAQSCIRAINASGATRMIPILRPAQLAGGREAVMREQRFDRATPLWFYILREAELAGGNHLGPLGSHLVADTLLGLIIHDPDSYWNAGPGGRLWSPRDARPSDPIDSIEKMLRFAGLLDR